MAADARDLGSIPPGCGRVRRWSLAEQAAARQHDDAQRRARMRVSVGSARRTGLGPPSPGEASGWFCGVWRPHGIGRQLDVLGRRGTAQQRQPVEEPVDDQVDETQRHGHDHAQCWDRDRRRSRAQADFWNPTRSLVRFDRYRGVASREQRAYQPAVWVLDSHRHSGRVTQLGQPAYQASEPGRGVSESPLAVDAGRVQVHVVHATTGTSNWSPTAPVWAGELAVTTGPCMYQRLPMRPLKVRPWSMLGCLIADRHGGRIYESLRPREGESADVLHTRPRDRSRLTPDHL